MAQAAGLHQAFQRLRVGLRVLAQPLGGAQLVAVFHQHVEKTLPVVGPDGVGRHGLPTPGELHGLEHLQGARIALGLLGLQPARVQVAGLHLAGDVALRAFGVHLAAVMQLAHVQRQRILLARCPGGRRQAAQVLEGVVRADHGIQVRAAREHRRIGLAQVRAQCLHRMGAVHAGHRLAVEEGLAHALQKHLAQPQVVAAQAAVLHGIGQAGAVVPFLVAKAAGLRQGLGLGGGHARVAQRTVHRSRVARHGVGGLGACGQGHGLVDQRHEGRKLVAVGAGNAEQHIDPLAAQLRLRDQFHPLRAAAAVPHWPHPQGHQCLRFHHALVAQCFPGPQRQRQALRHGAAMGSTPVLQPLLKQALRHLVGLARGQAAGVQAGEVAARGQAVGVADRVAPIGGGEVAPVQRGQQARDLAFGGQQALKLLRTQGQRMQRGSVCGLACRAVGHKVLAAQRTGAVACGRRGRLRRAQVEAAGSVGVAQRHVQPARWPRRGHGAVVDEKGLVDVLSQRFDQGLAQRLQNGLAPARLAGHLAQHGQALRLAALRQAVQVGVELLQVTLEVLRNRIGRPAQVAVQLVLHKLRDQAPLQRLARGACIHGFPLVHQLVHVGHAGIEARRGKRRRAVADQHRAAAPLGGQGLAQVVHDIGVHHRNVARRCAQRQPHVVPHIRAAGLAAGPFLRAMGAKVQQRIGLPRPQVHGQVVVRQRCLAFVHEGVLAQAQGFLARGLGQHRERAHPHARNDEDRLPLPIQHVAAALGRAPVGLDAGAHVLRQGVKKLAVARQGQRLGAVLLQQAAQRGVGVVSRQQGLQARDPIALGHLLRGVARLRQRARYPLQAARHVQERSAEVAAPGGVVVDHGHQRTLRPGALLQVQQALHAAHHGLGLAVDEHRAPPLLGRGRDQHRVNRPRALGLGQVVGHIGQGQAHGAVRPVGLGTAAPGLRGQQRHAPAGQQGLQGRRLADQLVQHQCPGVGAAVGVFQQGLQAGGVELLAKHGIGPQALVRKHPQPDVEPGGLAVDEMVAVHQHSHGRLALPLGLGGLPRRHGARIAEDAGRIGVVQAARGPGSGLGQRRGRRSPLPRIGQLPGVAQVGRATRLKVGHHALGHARLNGQQA